MLRHTFLTVLLSVLSVCTYATTQKLQFPVNEEVATAFGVATAKEYISMRQKNMTTQFNLDFTKAIVASVIDGNGRRFIQVGFHGNKGGEDFSAVFEVCPGAITAFSVSHMGFVSSLDREVSDFLSANENSTADFPNGCHW